MKKGIFSKTLFAENLKRFWAVSAVGFVIYFISGPFRILVSTARYGINENLYRVDYFNTWGILYNRNLGFEGMHYILPIVAAVCVFSYLNRVNSVGVVHSMPFSRRMLYITNYISGLVLCIVPLLLNWGLLAAACGNYRETEGFSYSLVNGWFIRSFTIVLFVFSIAVLACMVSGNSVIAVLTGAALNFLAAVLVICIYGYAGRFLYGFDADVMWSLAAKTSPLISMPINGGLSILEIVIYIVIALVISVLAYLLYKVRRLERCGDSYVFGWMQTVIGFLFVFVVTTGTGLVLFDGLGIAGYIVGFIVGFIIGQMISLKTFNIINVTCLRNFVVFALIMIAVVCAFAFDIFGYQKRVPKAEDVASVEIRSTYLRYDQSMMPVSFTSDGAVKAAVGLHQEIVDNYKQDLYEHYYSNDRIVLKYTLKDGSTLSRDYSPASFRFNTDSENFEKLRQSEEIINSIEALRKLSGEMRVDLHDYSDHFSDFSRELHLSAREQRELLNALADDMLLIQSVFSGEPQDCWLEISVRDDHDTDEEAEKYWSGYYGYGSYYFEGSVRYICFNISIDEQCKNTMEFLRAKGYID